AITDTGAASTAGYFIKTDTGTLIATAANSYEGGTFVNGGEFRLNGANGALTRTSFVSLNETGRLTLDSSGTNNTNRVYDFARVILSGGEISLQGNVLRTNESVGAVTFDAGHSTVTVNPSSGGAALVFGALETRSAGATVLYRGSSLGTGPSSGIASIFFSPSPAVTTSGAFASTAPAFAVFGTPTAPVLRGALYDGTSTSAGTGMSFATYSSSTGVRQLNPSSEQTAYDNANPATNADKNTVISLPLGGTLNGAQANTVEVRNSSGAQSITLNGVLMPANGLLFSGTGATSISGDQISSFSSGDLVILSVASGLTSISSSLQGVDGITIGGPGNFRLTGDMNAGSGATTPINFNGPGTVQIGSQSLTHGGVNINGGTLQLTADRVAVNGSASLSIANGATLDLNGFALQTIGSLNDAVSNQGAVVNINGNIVNSNTARVINSSSTAGARLEIAGTDGSFSGVISGDTTLALNGGTQVLANQNTYTGNTTIIAGTLRLGISNALPTTTRVDFAPTLVARSLDLAGYQQTISQLAGPAGATITNSGTTLSVLTVNQTNNTIYAGTIADGTGALGLTKTGSGQLNLTGNNSFTGQTLIQGGILNAGATGALGSGGAGTRSITVNSGGTLLISGGGSDHVSGAPLTLAGGTIKTAGAQEGNYTADGTPSATPGLGLLTLTANSTIDFSNVADGVLAFGYLVPNQFQLTITGYVPGAGTTGDHLVFTGDLLPFIAAGTFVFDGYSGPIGELHLGNNMYELVPVPEPGTWAAGILSVVAIAYRKRQRIASLLKLT
ncbi:MAG: autotransporter-associated beta strand repeat-containing protein, partial [Verrucomicrobiota bacterium]|nr:autotransporter-associated beta strand repeat-containing protein [Verrucomicrobiota bacterium]